MPKRIGFLYEKMEDKSFIRRVILEAARRKRKRREVRRVLKHLDEYVDKTYEMVVSESFVPTTPKERLIYDESSQKWRTIKMVPFWPDGVMHWLLVTAMKPVLMRGMHHWSCASIPGRGGKRVQHHIRRTMRDDPNGTKYAAELDIKKFYPSLSPREVMRFLRRKIKDEAFLGLIWRIIKDGIKIGFYISQWLANAVLEPLDHYIREKLGDGVRHYVRYIDNLTIFGHNKKKLHRAIRSIMEFFGENGPPPKGELATLQHPQTHGERGRLPLQAGPNSDPQEKPPPPEKTMHPGPETDRGPPQNSADPGTGNFITVGTAKALCRVEPLR